MVIKNTDLGGTDWVAGDQFNAADLNDTFDAAFNKIKSLSTFWLNSELYSVYDNFDSYGTGNFGTNAAWTITTTIGGGSAVAAVTIESSTNAGGSTKEMKFRTVGASALYTGICSAETKTATANKHKTCKMKLVITSGGGSAGSATITLRFNSTDYDLLTMSGADNHNITAYPSFYIHAKGSNIYDIYSGHTRIATDVNAADPDFKITLTSGTNSDDCILYIDDVVESAYAV